MELTFHQIQLNTQRRRWDTVYGYSVPGSPQGSTAGETGPPVSPPAREGGNFRYRARNKRRDEIVCVAFLAVARRRLSSARLYGNPPLPKETVIRSNAPSVCRIDCSALGGAAWASGRTRRWFAAACPPPRKALRSNRQPGPGRSFAPPARSGLSTPQMGRRSSDTEEESRSRRKKKHRRRSSSSSSSDSRSYGRKKAGRKSRSGSRGRELQPRSHSYEKRRRHRSSSSSSYGSRRKRSRSRSRGRGKSYRSQRSRSKSRTRRSRSRPRQRSYSRSSERSARRRTRSSSRERRKGKEKGKEKAKGKEKETHGLKQGDPGNIKAGLEHLTPAEQAKARLQLVLEAAAKADEALKAKERSEEEAKKRKEEDQATLVEQVKRVKEIEAIESDSFVPQTFRSTKEVRKSTEPAEPQYEPASIGLGTAEPPAPDKEPPAANIPTAIKYQDDNSLAHPNLFMEKAEAEEKWFQRLVALRQERLMGSPVA
ncbi:serine/Arginine-related protein 53 [Dryobates pubescens]|uniref:serine/Arginine-related protein 53 n=1 Tax=Dryobates pubescens TaxID=118200 RepID=UPI0023B8B6E6|nr:serine/Arginine-related protein 53 [Dryobates pubescens]